MASGNLVSVIAIKETTYNTIPTTGTFETMRFTSEDLSGTPQTNTSAEVRSDRQLADQFLTSTEVGGGIQIEFSATTYDSLLEGALNDTWATDVLQIGSDDVSFSIEKEFTDTSAITSQEFISFTGMRVATMDLNFTVGEAITGEFTFAGADITVADATIVGGTATVGAATTTDIMNGVGDVTSLKIDTVEFTDCIQSISLNIDNTLRPQMCMKSDTPANQLLGTANVTGTIEAYLSDASMLWYKNNVLGQTAMEIEWTVTDGSNSYVFHISNAKISGNAPSSDGLDTDVMVTAEFTALADATDTALKITRS